MHPGVVIVAGCLDGISVNSLRSFSAVVPEPARPEEFSVRGTRLPGSCMSAKRSPPIPHVWGATTPWTAFAAIAPSTALPPIRMMSDRSLRREVVRCHCGRLAC